MKKLPKIDERYWLSFIAASILGTNAGDFISDYLHLGHMAGLPYLAGVLVVIFMSERISRKTSTFFFWAAIFTVETAATNMGDAFHDFGIHFNLSLPIVLVLYLATVEIYDIFCKTNTNQVDSMKATRIYWICITLACVLGTISSDFASFGLGLTPLGTTIVFGIIIGGMLYLGKDGRLVQVGYYWTMLALIKTAGTAAGDFISHAVFGIILSTAALGLIFVGMVFSFYKIEKENRP